MAIIVCGLSTIALITCSRSPEERWNSLYSHSRVQFEQGDLDAALHKADQGFLESVTSDPVWNWKFRVLKAEILQWKTRSAEVLKLLSTPPPPELLHSEFAVRAKATEGMALVFLHDDGDDQGRFQEAEEMAAQSAPQLQCEVQLFRGNQALKKGEAAQDDQARRSQQYSLAEQLFRQSLQLARQYQQPFIESGALMGLGIVTTRTGRFDEAIDWSLESLSFARAQHSPLAENAAISNLAWSYRELGDLEKAISNYAEQEKAIDTLGQDQLKQDVLSSLGETYAEQRNYSAARNSYLKALALAKQMDREKRTGEKSRIVATLTDLADTELAQGNLMEAEQYNKEASDLEPRSPRVLLIASKIAVAHGRLAEAKALLSKITKQKVKGQFDSDFVQWDAQDEQAKLFAIEQRNGSAELYFSKLIKTAEAARSSLHVAENRLAFSSHAERYYDDYVRFLMDSRQPQKAFQVSEFSRARTLEEGVGLKAPIQPTAVNIERIQQYLRRSKKIILAYWIAPKESYVWMLSGSQFKFNTLAPGRTIEQAAKDYNDTLLGREDLEKMEQQGQELYNLLVKPIQQFIPHNAQLVIIPDRELDKLNFETLRHADPMPHFWIQDVEMQVASSTTMLFGAPNRPLHPDRKLLLIGNPLQASHDYPPLRHAAEEMQKVKGYFASDSETVISGAAAIPEAYASSHPEKFDVIHFVTHGTASELSPLDSAIILSLDPQNSFKLYARDIVKTRLTANIVTISACYGAGTRAYSGEGLVGLAWAFLQAGAHRVVAGLWEVDERASVELMDNFYAGIQGGQTPSEALHSAKMKMIEPNGTYSRPLYWAAFQLYMGS